MQHRNFPGFAKGQPVSGTHLQELHLDIKTKLSLTNLLYSSTHSLTAEVIFNLKVTHLPGQTPELPSWALRLLPAHSEMCTPLKRDLDKFLLGLTAKLILLRDLPGWIPACRATGSPRDPSLAAEIWQQDQAYICLQLLLL